MSSRPGENRSHRIQAIAARCQAQPRLVPVFARQRAHLGAPDIGRVADDDIVTAARHSAEIIGSQHIDLFHQSQSAHVAPANLQCGCRDIDGIDLRLGKNLSAGQCDRPGTGADVQDSAHPAGPDPRAKTIKHQLGDRRARHQHTRIHVQLESCKEGAMGKIGQRQPLADAPLEQRVDARHPARREYVAIDAGAPIMRETGNEEHQLRGFVARLRGAMTEMDPRGAQRLGATFNGGANGFAVADGFDGCVG